MDGYSESERKVDFEYFKAINEGFYSEHGHQFLAIRGGKVLDFADGLDALMSRMKEKGFEAGSYLLQNCNGDNNASRIVRLMINA